MALSGKTRTALFYLLVITVSLISYIIFFSPFSQETEIINDRDITLPGPRPMSIEEINRYDLLINSAEFQNLLNYQDFITFLKSDSVNAFIDSYILLRDLHILFIIYRYSSLHSLYTETGPDAFLSESFQDFILQKDISEWIIDKNINDWLINQDLFKIYDIYFERWISRYNYHEIIDLFSSDFLFWFYRKELHKYDLNHDFYGFIITRTIRKHILNENIQSFHPSARFHKIFLDPYFREFIMIRDHQEVFFSFGFHDYLRRGDVL